jgi:hypothetical protein
MPRRLSRSVMREDRESVAEASQREAGMSANRKFLPHRKNTQL